VNAQNESRDDVGFTLVELLVTMLIGSVLLSIGGLTIINWQRTAQQQGSSQELTSQLRKAAEQSVSEGRTYCVDLAPTRNYTLWRYNCGGTGSVAVEATKRTQAPAVTLQSTVTAPIPAKPCPTGDSCVYFYPRGTATPATIQVRSSARSKVYTVHVEGLTSRVYQ
jgi:prepilin-type N-terminal cleavage/methylation domain-containing protein